MCIELPSLGMLQAVLVLALEELPEECHSPDFGSRYQFHLAHWPGDKQGLYRCCRYSKVKLKQLW